MSWKPFTGSDRAYIVEHYHNTANEEIAKALGRTRESIASFARREKLRKDVGFIAPKAPPEPGDSTGSRSLPTGR